MEILNLTLNLNFLFLLHSDTFELFYIQDNGNRTRIPLMKKGIAWWTDRFVKFRNPGGDNLTAAFAGI